MRPRGHDDLDGLVVERILFSGSFSICAGPSSLTAGSSTSPRHLGREALRADDLVHLVIGDERAVHALGQPGARRQVQHVARTEQRFRARLVEDGARIHLG